MATPIIQRVLMTTDSVGGVWNYSLQLSEKLHEFGIQVVLACMGPALRSDQRMQADQLCNVILLERPCKLEWMEEPWEETEQAAAWLLQLENDFAPNVIHLNQFCFGSLPWIVPTVVVGHSCVVSWWNAVKRFPIPQRFTKYSDEVKKGLEAAGCVVAPSFAMLKNLRTFYGGTFRKTVVIANGRELKAKGEVKKEPFVLCSGRIWDEAKNIGSCIQSAHRSPWPIFIAGDCSGMMVPTTPNLAYLGILDSLEMEQWMHRASIFAHPARYEPFGLSVLEAALAGCALILGDIESLRENWDSAALFVPTDDPLEIANAIEKLTREPKRLQHYQSEARKRGRQLTPEKMALRYLRVYESLAEREAMEKTQKNLQRLSRDARVQ